MTTHIASDNQPSVLHVRVVTGTGGGPDKTILNSPRFLDNYQYRTACAFLHPPDDPGFPSLVERGQQLGARVLSIPDRGLWDFQVLRNLYRICRQEQVRLWHGHDYKSNALGLLLRRLWPMQLVTTVHGWVRHTKRTPLYYWIDRNCLRFYDRVICVSDDLREICVQNGVSTERCLTIENAIDTEHFHRRSTSSEAKRQLHIPEKRLLIGAVGRLSKEKGFDLLIQAVSQLIQEGHDLHLAIVGEGDEHSVLEKLIAEQQEPDRFQLLGFRSDVQTVYEAMDVFALSSIREGLPNVVLEAMALEVPVLATRIAGVPKLIKNEKNGLLVEPNNLAELTEGLKTLVESPLKREQLGQAGRETIEADYSFSSRMNRIHQIYTDLLQTKESTGKAVAGSFPQPVDSTSNV